MRRRTLLLLVMVVVLLLNNAAQAQGPVTDRVSAATLSGGRYQLIATSAPANTLASGGSYRLLAPAADPAPGCCCKTNLPCVVK